jgi:hypothetical protein
VFAHDIITKTRTLIDAKETGYAAGNTSHHTSNCCAKWSCRLATLLRTLSRATSNPLRLGRKRRANNPATATMAPMFRMFRMFCMAFSESVRHRKFCQHL